MANYTEPNADGDLMTVADFWNCVKSDFFTDEDGFGHPSNETHMDPTISVYPSEAPFTLPKDATHVVWFNK